MAKSCCNKACIVQGEKYRFSVLTPFMMRMEYSETGVFEDLQTQTVLNREFPVPEYSVTQSDDRLEIETEAFHMIYDKMKCRASNMPLFKVGSGIILVMI